MLKVICFEPVTFTERLKVSPADLVITSVAEAKFGLVPEAVKLTFFDAVVVVAVLDALKYIGSDLIDCVGVPVIIAVPVEGSEVNVRPKSSRSSIPNLFLSESLIVYVM